MEKLRIYGCDCLHNNHDKKMAATTQKSRVRAPSPAPSSSSTSSAGSQSSIDSDDIDVAPVAKTSKKPRKSKPGERLYYEPPPGMEQVRINVNYNSEFEWDSMKSKDGLEVWAIRLPVDVSGLYSPHADQLS